MGQATYASRQLDDLVMRAAQDCGAHMLRNVLVDLKTHTAHCSYLWIDRYGILAIDVQEWPGSVVKGTEKGRQWAASDQSGRHKFANPVLAAAARHGALVDALLATGRRLEPDYVQDLIVFIGADTAPLRIDNLTRARCISHGELNAHLRTRSDFPPNHGILEPHEVADLASLFQALDRSEDAEVVGRHAQATAPRRPSIFSRPKPAEVAVRNSVAGVAPMASRLDDRYPTTQSKPRRSLIPLLLLTILFALAVWLVVLDGTAWVTQGYELLADQFAGANAAEFSPQAQPGDGPGVDHAVQVFQESAPGLAAQVPDLYSPTVSSNGAQTSYTWVYASTDQAGASRTITLTFDAGGQLVGATE